MGHEVAEHVGKKACEQFRAHLAGQVEVGGRVGEYELGLFAVQKANIGGVLAGIGAEKPVSAQHPHVTRLADRRAGRGRRDIILGSGGLHFPRPLNKDIDVGHLEPGQLHLEIQVDQPLQLDGKNLRIPARLLGEAIVGKNVSALSRNNFAAATRPCPAMIRSSSSIRIGLLKPNRLIEAAICLICLREWVRALRSEGLSSET